MRKLTYKTSEIAIVEMFVYDDEFRQYYRSLNFDPPYSGEVSATLCERDVLYVRLTNGSIYAVDYSGNTKFVCQG